MFEAFKAPTVEEILEAHNAVVSNSHVVLSSGLHSDAYINMRVLAGKPNALIDIVGMISESITDYDDELPAEESPEGQDLVIVGPETLGRTLAELSAMAIASDLIYDEDVNFAWCEMKKDGDKEWAEWNPKLEFPQIVKGSRCYIVDDLLTTAKSVKLVKQLIEETGGTVMGVVVVVRRDPTITAETIGVPWLECLHDVTLQTYEEDACPLCADKINMRRRPGHGHEWEKSHPNYPCVD